MRLFFWPTLVLLLISSFFFALVLIFLPPKIGGTLITINLVYFFASLWTFLACSVSLVLYSLSFFWVGKTRPELVKITNRPRLLFVIAARRGVLASSLVVLLLGLRLLGIFNPINLVLLTLLTILVEFYFSNR